MLTGYRHYLDTTKVFLVNILFMFHEPRLIKTLGGVIVTPDFLDKLKLNGKTSTISTVTAIYDIGCFLGAISVIWIGDPLGRKKCVLIGTTIMSVGAILQIASVNLPMMVVGRIVAGIGNGINTSTGT